MSQVSRLRPHVSGLSLDRFQISVFDFQLVTWGL
jgi:hypothetical protein